MTRTASIGSRVPPAVTSTGTPARSPAPGSRSAERGRRDAGGVGQAAGADVAAGQATRFGLEDVHAPAAQRCEVLLHGRVLPHLGVHRGAHQHGRTGGEQGRGQQVVGDPGRVLPDELGGGGRDDDEVGALAEAGVRDRVGSVEQRRARRFGRQRRERDRADEALGVVGEHRDDVDARVDESPADLDRLVGGDPAGDAEDDVHVAVVVRD